MVKSALVEEDLAAGRRLVNALDDSGVPISAAFWLHSETSQEWRLALASPLVQELGPKAVYARIQNTVESSGLSLRDVSVITPSASTVKALRSAIHTDSGNTINGIVLDDAYVYRI